MIRSQLQDYCRDDPTWGFIAQLGAELFTGEVIVGTVTRVHLFVDEGAIYFAERDGDAPVQSRLVVRGALSPAQLARGGVFVDGSVSLARLFTRESSVDRHEVETALERLTQEVLDEVGVQPAGQVQLLPLRHHDSGIHEWARRIQPPVVRTATPPTPPTPVRATPPVAPLTIAPPATSPIAPPPLTIPPASFAAPNSESPFDAPPVPSTATSLPAPTATTQPVEDLIVEDLIVEDLIVEDLIVEDLIVEEALTPAVETAPAVVALPKLASRVMSVAEITAAQAVITGEAVPEEATDRFSPTDFAGMELPKLATKVMSVAELTAKLDEAAEAEAEAEAEEHTAPVESASASESVAPSMFDSGPVQAIHAAPLPGLPTLHMGPSTTPTALSDPAAAEAAVETPSEPPEERVVEPIAPWATPEQNLAAVEIWEMVDTMLADGHDDADLVSAGASTDAKGGRWRRGRKG